MAWDGAPARLTVHPDRAPDGLDFDDVRMIVESERGRGVRPSPSTTAGSSPAATGPSTSSMPVGTRAFGAHAATVTAPARRVECVTVLAAPTPAARPARGASALAGVRSRRRTRLHDALGAADLGRFERFAEWAGDHGARFVGTLPLLASFLDDPSTPAPTHR